MFCVPPLFAMLVIRCRFGLMMGGSTQVDTGGRNMKSMMGVILMELASKMEKILRSCFSVWDLYVGLCDTIFLKHY